MVIFLKLFLGIIFLILGYIFLYNPNILINFNRFAKEVLFNDRIILTSRKKLSIMFFALSFVALFMGISSLYNSKSIGIDDLISGFEEYQLYSAMQDYIAGRYNVALEKYNQILKEQPDNKEALKKIGYIYLAMGEYKKAKLFWQRYIQLYPNDKVINEELKKIQNIR